MGRPGVGKSTLINKILNKKKCKALNEYESVTFKITKCKHDEYPLIIFDSPGITENENESSDNIFKLIKDLNDTLFNICQSIHVIFFVINDKGRKFIGKDINIIIKLLKFKIPIFFIITRSEKKIYNKDKNIFEVSQLDIDYLSDTIASFVRNDKKLRDNEYNDKNLIKERIILVNLVKEPNNEEFGMDEIYNKMYNYFKPNLIDIEPLKLIQQNNNLQKQEKDEQIKEKVNNEKSLFFKNLKSMKDFLKLKEGVLNIIITQFLFIVVPLSFCPIPFIDDSILPFLIIFLIINISRIFNKLILIEEAKKIKSDLGITISILLAGSVIADCLKFIPGIGTLIGDILDLCFNSSAIYIIGKKVSKLYIKEMKDKGIGLLFIEAAKSYNDAIESFKTLQINYLSKKTIPKENF